MLMSLSGATTTEAVAEQDDVWLAVIVQDSATCWAPSTRTVKVVSVPGAVPFSETVSLVIVAPVSTLNWPVPVQAPGVSGWTRLLQTRFALPGCGIVNETPAPLSA